MRLQGNRRSLQSLFTGPPLLTHISAHWRSMSLR